VGTVYGWSGDSDVFFSACVRVFLRFLLSLGEKVFFVAFFFLNIGSYGVQEINHRSGTRERAPALLTITTQVRAHAVQAPDGCSSIHIHCMKRNVQWFLCVSSSLPLAPFPAKAVPVRPPFLFCPSSGRTGTVNTVGGTANEVGAAGVPASSRTLRRPLHARGEIHHLSTTPRRARSRSRS